MWVVVVSVWYAVGLAISTLSTNAQRTIERPADKGSGHAACQLSQDVNGNGTPVAAKDDGGSCVAGARHSQQSGSQLTEVQASRGPSSLGLKHGAPPLLAWSTHRGRGRG